MIGEQKQTNIAANTAPLHIGNYTISDYIYEEHSVLYILQVDGLYF